MEAWWYLWPDAVAAVHSGWRRLARRGQRVGLIRNVKEQLCADLRPTRQGKLPRDYRESDASKIAAEVRKRGLIDSLAAVSASFMRFHDSFRQMRL